MQSKKIVMLAGKGISTNAVFHSLNTSFGVEAVIVEDKESKKLFLKRRIRRLGLFTVAGQIAFQLTVVKLLNLFSSKRATNIIQQNNMNVSAIPEDKTLRVPSVNSAETIEILKRLNPDLIIVNGTRIISKKILQCVHAQFINTHAGITPMYRGAHGTYWALTNNDVENSGVTVHFVDEGIDTGNIISRMQVIPATKDNFTTYPLLQLAAGIKLLNKAVKDFFENNIRVKEARGKSKVWYHPTIWYYLYHRIVNKIK